MFPIALMLIILNASSGLGWRRDKDAVQRANDLFIGNLIPSDDQMGFEAAKEARASLRLYPKFDTEVDNILKSYLELEDLYKADCTKTGFVKVEYMRELILESSREPAFQNSRIKLPLISNFIEMEDQLLETCRDRLEESLGKLEQSGKAIGGMELSSGFKKMRSFRRFLGGEDELTKTYANRVLSYDHLKAVKDPEGWKRLYKLLDSKREHERKTFDEDSKELIPNGEHIKGLFKQLFESTCNLIDKDKDSKDIVEKGLLTMLLNTRQWEYNYDYVRAATDYQVCIEAREINLDHVVGELTKDH